MRAEGRPQDFARVLLAFAWRALTVQAARCGPQKATGFVTERSSCQPEGAWLPAGPASVLLCMRGSERRERVCHSDGGLWGPELASRLWGLKGSSQGPVAGVPSGSPAVCSGAGPRSVRPRCGLWARVGGSGHRPGRAAGGPGPAGGRLRTASSPPHPQQEAESNLRKAKQGYTQRCEDHGKAHFLAVKAEEEQAVTGPGAAASKTLDKRRRLEEEAKNKVSAEGQRAAGADRAGAAPDRGRGTPQEHRPALLCCRGVRGLNPAEGSVCAPRPPSRPRKPWPPTGRVWPMPRRRSRSWRTPR